jgi:hypothetical protein
MELDLQKSPALNDYKIDQALQAFERIEAELAGFSRHVPIIPKNDKIETLCLRCSNPLRVGGQTLG